jgi:hypothetical protein
MNVGPQIRTPSPDEGSNEARDRAVRPAATFLRRTTEWGRAGAWIPYAVAVAVSSLYLTMIFVSGGARLDVPFDYRLDALSVGTAAKSAVDTGWYTANDSLGLPGRLDMREFLQSDALHFVPVGVLGRLGGGWAQGVNLYFLLSFVMTACTALWAFTRLRVSSPVAVAIALMYAFLPFRFLRGIDHLALAYWAVPLIAVVAVRLTSRRPPFMDATGQRLAFNWKDRGTIQSLAFSVIVSMTGVYYAAFSMFLMAFAGLVAAASGRNWRRFLPAGVLIGVIALVVAVNLSPMLAYQWTAGPNAAMVRAPLEAEVYGLRVTQMLLPTVGHRSATLAAIAGRYGESLSRQGQYLFNESSTSSLGILGGLGLLIAVAAFLLRGRTLGRIAMMGGPILFMILVGTVSGIGALIAYVIPSIRCYNRISVVIAFFAFAALGMAAIGCSIA